MQGRLFSNDAVVVMVGALAIGLGVFLGIAFLRVRPDGSTIILVPPAGAVGALALAFILAGVGACCRVRWAVPSLALAFVALACCQVVAAAKAFGWIKVLQHTLFAVWLWGGAFVLWLHRKSAVNHRRLP